MSVPRFGFRASGVNFEGRRRVRWSAAVRLLDDGNLVDKSKKFQFEGAVEDPDSFIPRSSRGQRGVTLWLK